MMMRALFAHNLENVLRISGPGTPEPIGKPRGGLWVVWGRIGAARRQRLNPQIVLRKTPYFPGVTDEKRVRASGGRRGVSAARFSSGAGYAGIASRARRFPAERLEKINDGRLANLAARCGETCMPARHH
jgi:hypothetical protein